MKLHLYAGHSEKIRIRHLASGAAVDVEAGDGQVVFRALAAPDSRAELEPGKTAFRIFPKCSGRVHGKESQQ